MLDESAPYYVVSAASSADVTRTIIDGEPVYDQTSGVTGVDASDMTAVGDASAELWERL